MTRTGLTYLVSRFPVTSETFIVRELDAISRHGDVDIELRSLFPTSDRVVHDVARPWVARLIRPGPAAAAAGLGWAALWHPRAFGRIITSVLWGYRRRPDLLVRALVTVGSACAHARGLAGRDQPPHVHAHYATYPALAAWVCRQLAGTTYSFTVHAHDLYVDQSMLRRKVAEAEFVITISQFNRAMLEQLDAGRTPIEVIHCGIDTSAYQYRPRRIPAEGAIRALTVASLQAYKGHAVLFRAMAIGGPEVDRLTLDLIGDGVLRDELQQLATELGISERVNFLGSRTEGEVRDALARADLFVLPSVVAEDGQMEGLPVALMEALACGVPTVSTSLSGIPEIVIDGVTGLLARPADPQDLNTVVAKAIATHTPGMAEAGRELVIGEFDIRRTTAGLTQRLAAYCDAATAGRSALSPTRPASPGIDEQGTGTRLGPN